ncbi:MAG: stage III sporulation protein AA [Clostridia bacterium]|nr:stage III sporulation protein AA [Clostridia bacterium]
MAGQPALPEVQPALAEVLPHLAPSLRPPLEAAGRAAGQPWEEIRLRSGCPLGVTLSDGEVWLDASGRQVRDAAAARIVSAGEVRRTVEIITGSSLYAWENELRQGFLTLPGGHRVGLCGWVLARGNAIEAFRAVTSLNVRIARDVLGAADAVMPWILDPGGLPHNTLLFSPPGAGKTTVLRDLVRQLSQVRPDGSGGLRVAVVDERLELAGAAVAPGAAAGGGAEGVAGLRPAGRQLGPRVDVLAGCPKATGLLLVIRTMSPQVVVCDEVGRPEDGPVLRETLHAGVRVVVTAHGGRFSDLFGRAVLRQLVREGFFGRIVRLGRSRGPGTVEEIWDGRTGDLLMPASGRRGTVLALRG